MAQVQNAVDIVNLLKKELNKLYRMSPCRFSEVLPSVKLQRLFNFEGRCLLRLKYISEYLGMLYKSIRKTVTELSTPTN